MLKRHPLYNSYWESKRADVDQIETPVYCVASWTNPLHTLGTLNAWRALPENAPKWLRVHSTQEWSDYYADANVKDLQRFFDRYLKDDKFNGWESTPAVRVSVLRFGLENQVATVNRSERSFPLPQTKYVRHYLTPDNKLDRSPRPAEGEIFYNANSGKATFTYTMPTACETTGYFMAHLAMSCEDHDNMDVFVQVEKLGNARKARQGTLCITPPYAAVRFMLKLMHDYQIGVDKTGPLFYWGPSGVLRASHAVDKDEQLSTDYHPVYKHDRELKLKPCEKRTLDIAIKPVGLYWEKDDILQFTISGKEVIPFPIPGVPLPLINNAGKHVVHCGGMGAESSYLLVPYI